MTLLRIDVHFVKDDSETRKITVFLAHESGQQAMGELDRALCEIRENEDDVDLREKRAGQLHPLKFLPVGCQENCDRIRFNGYVESLPEGGQFFEGFDSTFRDHLMDRRLKPLGILIVPTRIE
jgi:hypothetical protein